MKKSYRFISFLVILISLCSLFSCAPLKLQGKFNASFSLTEHRTSDDQYQYEFYGDGQGIEKNTQKGSIVSFTYTVLNGSLTVKTETTSFTYQYTIENKKDFNITYHENGKSENALFVRK